MGPDVATERLMTACKHQAAVVVPGSDERHWSGEARLVRSWWLTEGTEGLVDVVV